MRARFELGESAVLSNRGALRVVGLALRYARPFAARFAVKCGLLLLSVAVLLVLPFPAKILIDHVVLAQPVAGDSNPLVREALLFAGLTDPTAIFWAMAVVLGLLLLLAGAIGSTGGERDAADAWLGMGQDTATRTENETNAGFSLLGGVLGLVDFFYTIRLSQDLNHHYRSALFRRIQTLPFAAFNDEKIGDAIYRVLYDTPSVTNTVYRVLLTPVGAPAGIAGSALLLYIAFGDHPAIYLSAVAMLPVALFAGLVLGGLLRRRESRSRRAGALTTATVEESLSGVAVTRAFGAEGRERMRFDAASWRSFSEFRGMVAAGMAVTVLGFILAYPIVVPAVAYVLRLLAAGIISPGDLALVFGYFFGILGAAVDLGAVWPRIQGSVVGLHRVFHVLENLPSETDDADRPALAPISTGIVFDGVCFAYDGVPALQEVSFEARSGTLTAIVGAAGAGKTTLVSLVPRFHDPDAGRVLADGVDLAGVRRDSVRAQVAFVFQEAVLFDDSVAENIRFGRPAASDDDVRRAACQAHADEFIRALPQGYQTRLGRAGAKLSVGQKQRLQVARALVRDAPILVLDEPTAALDPETEAAIVRSLRYAGRDRVVLVVAHRLSTVREADQILFLDAGRIVERGTHADLMARAGGAYRRFCELGGLSPARLPGPDPRA
jgi:ABC-type multidrug transport system fused ATPase/permease subunit